MRSSVPDASYPAEAAKGGVNSVIFSAWRTDTFQNVSVDVGAVVEWVMP